MQRHRHITPFCNRVWSIDTTIWTFALSRAPAPGARDTSDVQTVLSIDQTRSQKGLLTRAQMESGELHVLMGEGQRAPTSYFQK